MMTNLIQSLPLARCAATGGVIQGRGSGWCYEKGIDLMASGTTLVPRLSVVDDDENVHLFLKDLEVSEQFKVVGSFYHAAEALDRLPEIQSDAVIMDLRLPDMSGIDCTTKLKAILPRLPILILTGYPDAQSFFRSVLAGAQGFVVKPVAAKELLDAIQDVLKGEFVLAKQIVPFVIQIVNHVSRLTRESHLTSRQEEILACLFQGMQDKEIASTLGIGTATVHTHMHRLFEKLGVHSRRDIIAKYLAVN